MDFMTSLESTLIQVQIDYIKKELNYIKDHYMGQYTDQNGEMHDMDMAFFRLHCTYEAMIEEEKNEGARLELYKKLYQECSELAFESILEEPLLVERSMCGTEDVLVVYDEDEKEEVLPF